MRCARFNRGLFTGSRPRSRGCSTTSALVWLGANSTSRGNGVSGPGGVDRHPGRDRTVALYRGSLRALLRLLFSASAPHPAAGRRAGMGGHDRLSGLLLVVGRVAEMARRQTRRRSSGTRMWSGSTR